MCVVERERERERGREGGRKREGKRERMYVKLHVCTIDGSSKYNLSGNTHTQTGRQGGCTHITQQLDLAHFTLYELRAQVPLSSHGCKEERRDVR